MHGLERWEDATRKGGAEGTLNCWPVGWDAHTWPKDVELGAMWSWDTQLTSRVCFLRGRMHLACVCSFRPTAGAETREGLGPMIEVLSRTIRKDRQNPNKRSYSRTWRWAQISEHLTSSGHLWPSQRHRLIHPSLILATNTHEALHHSRQSARLQATCTLQLIPTPSFIPSLLHSFSRHSWALFCIVSSGAAAGSKTDLLPDLAGSRMVTGHPGSQVTSVESPWTRSLSLNFFPLQNGHYPAFPTGLLWDSEVKEVKTPLKSSYVGKYSQEEGRFCSFPLSHLQTDKEGTKNLYRVTDS